MDGLLCHSGMVLGSIATVGLVVASVGGLILLAASALRRTISRPTNS